MNRINYQKEMEKMIQYHQERNEVPRLLLHSCCAPCSSYCIEYLSDYFEITVFYYNPNITQEPEYVKRVEEQKLFIERFPAKHKVTFLEGNYEPMEFYSIAKGLADAPEGGERCKKCYALRLWETGKVAKQKGFDYFTTTLSISPLKNAQLLNEIGEQAAKQYQVPYLYSDFKKKEGYKRSVTLSKEYGLYRQEYCGCIYSMNR